MTLREAEAKSISDFLHFAGNEGVLSGKVLDYGCGLQPYRELIESHGGEYVGYDRPWFPAHVGPSPSLGPLPEEVWWRYWDAVVCTQVVQYIPLDRYGSDPSGSLQSTFREMKTNLMVNSGHLVMTYPTHWPEVEREDLHRFTKTGMELLLLEAGFEIVEHLPRHSSVLSGETFVHGYGVVARA